MKLNDVMKLPPGATVIHKRYGECVVREVMLCFNQRLFGVVITPSTKGGRELLRWDSGMENDAPLLEDSIRRLKMASAAKGGAA